MQATQTYDGSYEAARAAALSGVPLSTVYDWARKSLVVPSIAPERPKLWSYADLMALRIVSWLRHPKEGPDEDFPASPMGEVRSALARLGSRTTTLTMAALANRGYPLAEICALYPEEDRTAIAEAIEFESSLNRADRAA